MKTPLDLIPEPERHLLQLVTTLVAEEWPAVTLTHLRLRARPVRIAEPRNVAMFLAYQLRMIRLPSIGGWLDRDHSNVLCAHRQVRGRMDVYPEFRARIERLKSVLEERIKEKPNPKSEIVNPKSAIA